MNYETGLEFLILDQSAAMGTAQTIVMNYTQWKKFFTIQSSAIDYIIHLRDTTRTC